MASPEDPPRLPDRAPAPEELVGLLSDGVRRRMVAVLVLGGRCRRQQLFDAAACEPKEGWQQLARLERAGVVTKGDDGMYAVDDDVFHRSVRDAASERVGPLNDRGTQLVRRYFFRNRLVQIPSEPWALDAVLDLIVEDFQPGEVYDEREVNTTLLGWHGDWAALRRMLVDHGHLERDHGRYRRVTAPA